MKQLPTGFNKDFLWGGAVAACQIEGAYDVDGRGLSTSDIRAYDSFSCGSAADSAHSGRRGGRRRIPAYVCARTDCRLHTRLAVGSGRWRALSPCKFCVYLAASGFGNARRGKAALYGG